jgi:amidase
VERIERHNPQLNAVVFKAYDEARAMANTNLSGPFAGVPMLLKDALGYKKGWRNGAAPASCQRYLRASIQRW